MTAASTFDRISVPDWLAHRIREADCTFALTGASGWIGSAILDLMDGVFGDDIGRNVQVFGSQARAVRLPSARMLQGHALADIGSVLTDRPCVLLHCAFLTKDRESSSTLESYVAANTAISDSVARVVRDKPVRGLFAPSSGAVYRRGSRVLNDDIAANPYGALKIRDEERFTALAKEAAIPLCLPRIFNLAGPYINKIETYALSSMICGALVEKAIVVRAAHSVVRSYIHIGDIIALMFAMLLDPRDGDQPIFDTAGRESIEVGDLAMKICSMVGLSPDVIRRPERQFHADDIYVGDARSYAAMLAARGLPARDLPVQLRDTLSYIRAVEMPHRENGCQA